MINYFKSEKVTKNITAIRSRSGEIMYLIEGEGRAVLIDTCLGIKGLRSFVEQLTTKPITVLLTHGHVDHAMGAPEFDDVYLNLKDLEIYQKQKELSERKGYIAANIGGYEDWMDEDSNFVPSSDINFQELMESQVFDLGKIHIEVYALGGHTKGTMVMLIPEEKILITGDACNTATFLFDENALPVETYRKNLVHVDQLLEGRFERIFMMHHDMEASKGLLKNVIKVCDEIMEQKADDMDFSFMGQSFFVAKRADKHFVREDGGEGNVVYSKEKVFVEE